MLQYNIIMYMCKCSLAKHCRLSICEKALAEYLETKRLAFPRFYFVSSADLLDILSKGNQPVEVVITHRSISGNVHKLSTMKQNIQFTVHNLYNLVACLCWHLQQHVYNCTKLNILYVLLVYSWVYYGKGFGAWLIASLDGNFKQCMCVCPER